MLRPLLFAALALAPASASAAELVSNGGFENPTVSNSCCSTVPPEALPGWTVNSGNINVVNGTFSSTNGNLAHEGSQYLDLVGQGGVGSISQTIATVAGQLYTLSFWYSHNLFAGLGSASASLSIDGLNDTITHSTGSNANLDWKLYSQNFTASGNSATLSFVNTAGAGNEGIFLDSVSISAAVPEPSTWAMMLIGFGAVGFGMRKRKATQGQTRLRVAYA